MLFVEWKSIYFKKQNKLVSLIKNIYFKKQNKWKNQTSFL